MVINGTTISGYAFGTKMVQLNGSSSGGGDGLTLVGDASDGSTIEGLNIVTFSSGAGIRVESDGNQIFNDYVGALAGASPTPAPNAQGIFVSGSNNTIGGTAAGAADTIADNNGPGVTVNTGTGDLISGNAIFNNVAAGIVLQNGGNQSLGLSPAPVPVPAPILISALTTGSEISISGELTGFAASTSTNTVTITIEFFASTGSVDKATCRVRRRCIWVAHR